MASVTTIPKSPYWIARMRVWIAAPESQSGGFWRLTMRSTKLAHKTTSKRAAKAMADEMERAGRELRSTIPDEHWYASRLDAMLRLANVANPRKKTTWAKAAEGWIAAKTCKPSSVTKYQTDIAHFARWLGSRSSHNLRDVTADDISAFYKDMLEKGYSQNTSILVTRTVCAVLRRATLLRQIESNPAELLTLSRTEDGSKRRCFTPEEIKTILSAVADDEEWTVACLFGLFFGMRLGDACNRRYEEIQDGVLRFVPQKKSRRGRVIAVPLVGALAKLPQGTGPITPRLHAMTVSVASGQFSRILIKAGIVRLRHGAKGKGRGVVDATFHSWRHTTNSLLVDAGVDQRVRQLICDHDSVKVSNNYTHASLQTMSKALEKLTPHVG